MVNFVGFGTTVSATLTSGPDGNLTVRRHWYDYLEVAANGGTDAAIDAIGFPDR